MPIIRDTLQPNHTTIRRDGLKTIVQYYRTEVVTFDHKTITLDNGGHETITTSRRMNEASRQFNLGYQVYQYKFNWFVSHNGKDQEFRGNSITIER